MIASRFSTAPSRLPGRLITRASPRTAACARDRGAKRVFSSDRVLISSPNPGRRFVVTASVASGVTSLSAIPVPPVVITSRHPKLVDSLADTCRDLIELVRHDDALDWLVPTVPQQRLDCRTGLVLELASGRAVTACDDDRFDFHAFRILNAERKATSIQHSTSQPPFSKPTTDNRQNCRELRTEN